jgi:FKBP-type peptidyl-prolyl cis-trans isomerase
LYYDSQKLNNPFNHGFGEPGLVPGLKKALNNAKRSDLMLIHVPSDQAYGSKGYLEYVEPNEDLFYRVMVLNVVDNKTEN